jgi:glycosyltransferase involved in cell wall biosynthesis
LKIALLIHELLVEGGTERQCVALARSLTEQGHDVALYTCAYDRERCYREICEGLDVRVAGRGRFPRLKKPEVLRRYLDMRKLASCIQEGFDVWNPHHWPPHWAALEARRRFGGVVVWMCNDVPDMYEKAQKNGGPPQSALRRYWYRLLFGYDQRKVERLNMVTVLAEWVKQRLVAIYPSRVEVVRSGVDWQKFGAVPHEDVIRSRFGFGADVFLVLCLGILLPHRRLEDGIAAIAQLRARDHNVKLLIAGSSASSPDYFAGLQRLVREPQLKAGVVFAGGFPENELKQFYDACDVFLFANENQTWGLAVIEAMACGKPVIVSTGAGVHEVLEDAKTALLVPPRNPEAIALCIELLMRDPALRRRLGENGRNFVRERFSWNRYAQDMVAVFEKAVSSRCA